MTGTVARIDDASFEARVNQAVEAGTLVTVDSLDLVSKDALLKIPFIVTGYTFHEGDYGPFVTVKVLTKDDNVFGFNDGSTGVYAQLAKLHEALFGTDPKINEEYEANILAKYGLRISEYVNEHGPGQTYYLT